MNKTVFITSLLLVTSMVSIPVVFSDDDHNEYRRHSLGVAAVTSPLYKAECASCHMAYLPGLLPASSWEKIMSGLESHFGDNAELDADSFKTISEFLVSNSADNSDYRRSRKIMRSVDADDAPIRITQIPYIKRKHHEIPARLIQTNPDVGSLSNCIACHTDAEKGMFNEHSVRIPGYGRWDD